VIGRILEALTVFIVSVISTGGYGGIVALMAIESACIPLPSEIIMPFAGYLVSTGKLSLFWVATAGAIGCNVGSALAYAVGWYGGEPAVRRFGRYLLVTPHEIDRAHAYFVRWGAITIFIGRLLPVVRTFIALPGGIARMPFWQFHLYTFLGSWPWCFALAWIGKALGEQWNSDPRLHDWFHRADGAIAGVIVLAAAWFLWSRRSAFSRIKGD
jgi:membrane protein DedA with SNARE-associated domain